jgi:uncharacterized protein GlcG (DUF336 family)
MSRNPFLGAMKSESNRDRTETQREIRSMTLTLAQANKIIAAAIAQARQLNIIVNVAVCDNQGHLIAFNRMYRAMRRATGSPSEKRSRRRALGYRVARSEDMSTIRRLPT